MCRITRNRKSTLKMVSSSVLSRQKAVDVGVIHVMCVNQPVSIYDLVRLGRRYALGSLAGAFELVSKHSLMCLDPPRNKCFLIRAQQSLHLVGILAQYTTYSARLA